MTREELLELAKKWEQDQSNYWFENTPENEITWTTFIEGFKAGIRYGFEKARELKATGEFFEDLDVVIDKYESAEQVIEELDNDTQKAS